MVSSRHILTPLMLGLLAPACMRGPALLRQRPAVIEPQTVVVETREANGAVTGALDPASKDTQVIQASDSSAIAGATVEFPPGSIALPTDITLSAGLGVATDATLDALGVASVGIVATSAAVSITASVSMDTQQPFTVSLPLPSGSGLNLADPYDNLVVFYQVQKAGEGDGFAGVYTREMIQIDGKVVKVAANHFGTFQAVITAKKIEAPVEKSNTVIAQEQAVKEAEKRAETRLRPVYYVRGFATATFGDDLPSGDGLQGGFATTLVKSTIKEDMP